jgi:hypothetical protein
MPDCSKNSFTWTVIPTGIDPDGRQHVAVHLALRLGLPPSGKPERLSSYHDFVDWPATIRTLQPKFQLLFYDLNGTAAPWKITDTEILSVASSDIWTHLFPLDTSVKACQPSATQQPDPRTRREYESYSMRKIADHTENMYLNLAARSFDTVQQSDKLGNTYRTRFTNSAVVPIPRPTVVEARSHFAPLHVFQPQAPSEEELYCLDLVEKCFADWVEGRTENPPLETRRKISGKVKSLIGKLQPSVREGSTAPPGRRSLKPAIFKAIVTRAFKNLGVNSEYEPKWPDCVAKFAPSFGQGQALDSTDLLDHALFHRQLPEMCPQPKETTPYDFHELMSMLSSHPDLYPKVGLVFDLRVIAPIDLSMRKLGRVAAKITWRLALSQAPSNRYPLTAYEVFSAPNNIPSPRFLPCSRTDANAGGTTQYDDVVRHGTLEISDPNRFHIQTMDTHGDYFKGQAVQSNEESTSPDRRNTEREEAIPKLRSCGLALVKDNRKAKVEAVASRNAKLQADLEADKRVTFFAEDLTLGYRVDVFTVEPHKDVSKGSWNSLCLRSTVYELITPGENNNWTPKKVAESSPISNAEKDRQIGAYERLCRKRIEGIVQASASRAADASNSEFQLLETVTRWENWSLAAPVPIKNPALPAYDSTRKPLRLRATHSVSRSLPRLKFGNRYYLRCRAAFLDGSGLSMDECDSTSSKLGDASGAPFPFKRLESIDSPVVLLDEPIKPSETPGDQLAHLVLRSNDESTSRHVVPPRVSPNMALLHGFFDQSRKGAFTDYIWNTDGTFASVCQFNGQADCKNRTSSGADGNAIFKPFPGSHLEVRHPYLPDPAARRLQITLLHRRSTSTDVAVEIYDFYSSQDNWPEADSLEVQLEGPKEGQTQDAVLELNQAENSVKVSLKEGRMASLILTPTLEGVNLRGIPLIENFKFSGDLAKRMGASQRQLPNLNLHWLLVAQVKLDLVNAVQKPLEVPNLESITITSQLPSSNSVQLKASVIVDPDSTGQIDISATWTDKSDDISRCDTTNGTPEDPRVTSRAHVLSQKVELPEFETPGERNVSVAVDHLIGDTKYHAIKYSVSGKCRFAPYYSDYQSVIASPRNEQLSAKFTAVGGGKEKKDKIEDLPIYVCNRGIPDVPKILYMVPIFRWDLAETERGRKHRRYGGGLRVYMDPQWYSSGDGELLAVVLAERPFSLPSDAGTLVTQWGIDPLWEGNALPQPPTPNDFEGEAGFVRHCENKSTEEKSLPGLEPAEYPGLKVTALGFSPKVDCERKLRYCDVIMRPQGAYYPFVRFALARFQPNSIAGAHLSKIVTADFMQLAPDRWVVTYFRKHKLQVYVYGFTYRSSFATSHGSEMDICVEKRVQGRESDFCWIPALDPGTGKEIRSRVSASNLSAVERLAIGANVPDEVEKGMAVWHAEFDLKGVPLGSDRRVIVQEIETYQADDRGKKDSVSTTIDCERVVFADALKM